MKVLNFDGEALSSVKSIKEIVKLVSDNEPKVVVFSSVAGVKEHLEQVSFHLFNREPEKAHDVITKLEFYFTELLNNLLDDEAIRKEAIDYMLDRFNSVWKFIRGRFTAAEEREVVAQGTLISTALFGFYLREHHVPNVMLPATDFMQLTLNREPEKDFMKEKLGGMLRAYPDKKLFITQNNLCLNAYGEVDCWHSEVYPAALIAEAINADEFQIWSDYPLDISNKAVRYATRNLSFDEAEELSFYEKHIPSADDLAPVSSAQIPVRLLNINSPEHAAILISGQSDTESVKAVASKDSVMFLKLESTNVLRSGLFLSKVFDVLAKYKASVCLVSTSATDVSLAMERSKVLSSIIRELTRYTLVRVEDRMSIVSIIGNMRWQYSDFADHVLGALKGIPVRMISYGGSNHNLSFIVRTTDKSRAIQLLNL